MQLIKVGKVLWEFIVYSIIRVSVFIALLSCKDTSSTPLLLQINKNSSLLGEVKSAPSLTFDNFTLSQQNASDVLPCIEISSPEDDSITFSENLGRTGSEPQTPHSKWDGVCKIKDINGLNLSINPLNCATNGCINPINCATNGSINLINCATNGSINPINCACVVVITRQMDIANSNDVINYTDIINITTLQTGLNILYCNYRTIMNISVTDECVYGIKIYINHIAQINTSLRKINISKVYSISIVDECVNNIYFNTRLTKISKNKTNGYDYHSLLLQCTITLTNFFFANLSKLQHPRCENVTFIVECILHFQSLFDSLCDLHLYFTSVTFDFAYSEFVTPSFSTERKNTSLGRNIHPQQGSKIYLNDVIHFSRCADDYFQSFVVCVLCVQWIERAKETNLSNASNGSLAVRFVSDAEDGWPELMLLITFHPDFRMSANVNLLRPNNNDYYHFFMQNPECSLQSECQLGGEEKSCHFTYYFFNGKCYTYHHTVATIAWKRAQISCQKRGGNLVMPKSPADRDAIRMIYNYKNITNFIFTGLHEISVRSKEHSLYTKHWMWVDGTVAYNVNISGTSLIYQSLGVCSYFNNEDQLRFFAHFCIMEVDNDVICEADCNFNKSLSKASIMFPDLKLVNINLNASSNSLVLAKDGHFTHDFLSCQSESLPGEKGRSRMCQVFHEDVLVKSFTLSSNPSHSNSSLSLTEMFVCKGEKTLHYTLVCDFKPDCDDGSDEDFCRHYSQCPEHTCQSGQCIRFDQICDYVQQCWDESDERSCTMHYVKNIRTTENAVLPPSLINFDARGNILYAPYNPIHPCPSTHFHCHGDLGNCLPVYVRCNGIYDCPDQADEDDCGQYSCPGFYRCYNSSICLHVDHLCDGVAQCPYRDDEVLCDFQCPEECLCQGLAFICRKPFLTEAYPDVRYLDAHSSGMSMSNVTRNMHLVWLRLRHCNISDVIEMLNPNLRVLDLSKNKFTSINMDIFYKLSNLVELNLSENPIVHLRHSLRNKVEHSSLQSLDLSRTAIRVFESIVLNSFPRIAFLNLSFCILETIGDSGFLYAPNLKNLDIRGNALEDFSQDLFKRSLNLQRILASNFKLCCKAMLPEIFDENDCFAPVDEISSCEDLLRSNFYRMFNWIISSLTIVGNVGSFMFLTFSEKRKSKSGYKVLVINLCLADILMGIYLLIVGVADQLFVGNYFVFDYSWRNSVACIIAGFLSLLSLEVSSITILLITLDRFIALRFPMTKFAYRMNSLAMACVIAWVVGILLAAIPLMPMTSEWKFFTQTGICVPLPFIGKDYPGKTYSYSLVIIFNIALLVLIALGQLFIYMSVAYNSISSVKTRKSGTIAQRLSLVVISNFLCLFPLGIVAFVSSTGFAVPSEVMVTMVIFILPLNAALNPFVYTFNRLADRRRKAHELKLLQLLENRFESEAKEKLTEECSKTEETQMTRDSPNKAALRFLSNRLANHEITLTSVLSRLEIELMTFNERRHSLGHVDICYE